MALLLSLGEIAERLHDPETGRQLHVIDVSAWRTGSALPAFPSAGYETRDDRTPLWDWWTVVVPWLVATGRARMLGPVPGLLRVYETQTGGLALAPTVASVPGTFDAGELPDLTVARLARLAADAQRYSAAQSHRYRDRQRQAGMHRPMSAKYAASAAAARTAARREAGTVHVVEVATDQLQVFLGTQMIGDWYREHVPACGLTWCWYPAGHARPAAYQSTRPQGWPCPAGAEVRV